MDLLQKWTKTCKTVDDVQQFIGKEQFLETLSNPEQKLWVMEKKPKTSIAAGELADEYEQARQPGLQKARYGHQVGTQKPISQTNSTPRCMRLLRLAWAHGKGVSQEGKHEQRRCRKGKTKVLQLQEAGARISRMP